MGRIAGVPNRLTTQMKQKLQELIDDIITDIEVEDLNTNQKLKLLQIFIKVSKKLLSLEISMQKEIGVMPKTMYMHNG